MELETAMYNVVISADQTLQRITKLYFTNFNLNEETLLGAGSTRKTYGKVLQEVIESQLQQVQTRVQ